MTSTHPEDAADGTRLGPVARVHRDEFDALDEFPTEASGNDSQGVRHSAATVDTELTPSVGRPGAGAAFLRPSVPDETDESLKVEPGMSGRLERCLSLYEMAMFGSDRTAIQEGTTILEQILAADPARDDARRLYERFETLGKMLDASPHHDPSLTSQVSDPLPDRPMFGASGGSPGEQRRAWSRRSLFAGFAGCATIALLVSLMWRPGTATPVTTDAAPSTRASVNETHLADIPATTDQPGNDAAVNDIGRLAEVILAADHDAFLDADAALPDTVRGGLDELMRRVFDESSDIRVEIEGHADRTGTHEFNQYMGLVRAEKVREYLHEEHGLPLHVLHVTSYGEERPIASNDTSGGRSRNRRVVVRVLQQATPEVARLAVR